MKKFFFLAISCCITTTAFCQPKQTISLIPEPVQMTHQTGTYVLPKLITISAADKTTAGYLQQKIITATGYTVSIAESAAAANIQLVLNSTANSTLGKEGYQLSVTP